VAVRYAPLYPAQVREQAGRDEDNPEDVDGETKGPRDQAGGVAQQTAAEPPDTLRYIPFNFRGRQLRRASQEAPLIERRELRHEPRNHKQYPHHDESQNDQKRHYNR
jgi:hypothetical protein